MKKTTATTTTRNANNNCHGNLDMILARMNEMKEEEKKM